MWWIVLSICVDPARFGAIPDDNTSDTAAFQRAVDVSIASKFPMCVSPGVWTLTRPKGQLGSLMITGGPLTIRARDPQRPPVLRMAGDGNKGHWAMIEMRGAQRVTLSALSIDGLGAYNTEEQTHLVEIGPDSNDVVISNVHFGPMRQPTERVGAGIGGDCIRLLGNPGHEVERVVISNSTFTNCDRSAIGLQRSLKQIVMSSLSIRGTGDTPIDFEPTGAGGIEDVVMSALDIERAPDAQGAWSVTIGGVGKDLARRVVLADSKLGAGGVGMINVADVEIVHNEIVHHAGIEGVVSVMRRGLGIRIAGNKITRPAGTPAGPLVRASHNNGYAPEDLIVEDNILDQKTSSPVVYSASARSLIVRHNTVKYSGSDPRMGIVVVEARATDAGNIQIVDNAMSGGGAVLLAGARKHGFETLEVQRNATDRTTVPVRCDGAAGSFRAIVVDRELARGHGCDGVPLTRRSRSPTRN